MPVDITFHDNADVQIAAALVFDERGGQTSAAQTVRIYNGFATSADPGEDLRLLGWAVPVGASEGSSPVAAGVPVVDRYMVEARVVSGLGGLTVASGQWQALGPGTELGLPSLTDGQGVETEVRLRPPSGAQGAVYRVYLTVVDHSTGVGDGAHRVSGGGVHLPIGDGQTSLIIEAADVVQNPGGADDQVQAGPAVYLDGAGVPRSISAALHTLTAAAAGLNRYDLLSVGASGVTVTSGTEISGTLTDDDRPAIPAGEEPLAWVVVDDSGIITDGEITQAAVASLYVVTAGGTTATVARGPRALVGGFVPYNLAPQTVELTDDASNSVWLLATGEVAATVDGALPGTPAELLAEVDVAAGAVTEIRDRRRWLGARLAVVRFEWAGTLSAAGVRHAVSPFDRPAYILPIRGLRAAVGDPGSTSGSTDFGLEAGDLAGGWTDMVGTDRPPSIAQGAADPRDLGGRPQAYEVPAGARLRATVTAVPGTASTDGVLEVLLWAA